VKETGSSQVIDMEHQITVALPDEVYDTLHRWAKAQKKSVRKVAEETLRVATRAGEDRSSSLEDALQALVEKSDEELWQIAESRWTPNKERKWKRLIVKRDKDRLTEAEGKELQELVADAQRFMVIQSEAWVLLKRRGHRIPTLEELQQRARAKGWMK
jgi:hypothetical protein